MTDRKRHPSAEQGGARPSKLDSPAQTRTPVQSPQKPLQLSYVQETITSRPETLSKLDSNLWSWLHRAAHQGRVEIVEYLLAQNLKYAESLSSSGGASLTTSQQLTTLSEHSQRLLPVNQQDVFGRSALHVAASYGTLECIQAMMEYNASVSKLLHTALPRASPELKLLLSLDLDLRNTKGQTAALCAARKGDISILSALLASGADPNVQDDHKLGCLQLVCSKLDPSLASSPTDSSHTSSTSSAPISLRSATSASSSSHSSHHHHGHATHSSLNKSGLIIDSPDFTNYLAEHSRLLIQNGADLSLEDLHQENVLHYACRRVDTELLQTLLHNGKLHQTKSGLLSALRALYAKEGKLPASIASRLECVDLLNAAYLAQIHKEVEAKGIAKMTTNEVCEWLVSIGLQVHRDLFLKHCVTGAFLQQVSEETIKSDLGMESLGQRIAFVSRLEELKDIDKRRAVAASASSSSSSRLSSIHPLDGSGRSEDETDDEDAILLGLPNAKDYEINYEDLVLGDVIGRGNFGEVRRGQWSAVQVAVKTIYRTGGEAAKKDVYREMGILAQLRHPNILGFLGYVKYSGSVMMVTDLMSGGSLHNLIQSSFDTVSRLRFGLVSGIVRGMVYLHHRRLVHRDLNTKNLLLDDHYGIKISDFGLSRPKYDHKMTMSVGFLGGMAPEVYRGNDYTEKADVFSFAMVVYEIVTGKESHHAQSNVMMYAHNVSQHGYRPPLLDDETPPIWNNFIRKCWAQDPLERPSFSQLLDELNVMEQTGARTMPSIPVTLTESGAYIT